MNGRACLLSVVLVALGAPAAWAQSEDSVVVVSGRRVEQTLRDVPASLTVVQAAEIARAGLVKLRDVADLAPNFSMLDNYRPGLDRIQMRGLITPQVGDPPVAFVIDGVTAPSPEFVTQPLFDIARVEVLRGAQGALYGRSSVGGAVYIVSAPPSDHLAGDVRASYGAHDQREISAVVSGPALSDVAHFRVGAYAVGGDGAIENIFLYRGADYARGEGWAAELALAPSPRTSLSLRGRIDGSRDGIGYYDAVSPTRESLEDFSSRVSENVQGANLRRLQQFTAKLEHQFELATLTIAGGYSRVRSTGVADADLTALPSDAAAFFPSVQQAIDASRAWTFESRLVSHANPRWGWALGAFYQDRKGENTFSVFDDAGGGATPVFSPDLSPSLMLFSIVDENSSRSWALSGEANYHFTEALELALAGRYDRDARRSVDPRDAVITSAHATFDQFQPKLSLSYHVDADTLLYGGYSRGFRSGGFNQYHPLVPREFGAETTNSYEAGVRMSRANGRVSLNATLFRNDQADAQLTRFNPDTFTLENISIDKVSAEGGELELSVQPAERFSIRLGAGYTNSEIRAFAFDPTVVGAPMPYVAQYDLTLRLNYWTPLGADWRARYQIAYRRSGPRSFTLDFPALRSEAHDFLDARIALEGAKWTLSAYGDNLLDERQPEDLFGVFNGPVQLARQPNRPRQFGVELRYAFAAGQ